MIKKFFLNLIFLALVSIMIHPFFIHPEPVREKEKLDQLYRQGQELFHQKHYQEALLALKTYIETSGQTGHRSERLLWAIDQIGRIYLSEQSTPDEAIEFFEEMLKDSRLNEAEEDTIEEWIAAAWEWKRIDKSSPTPQDPNKLFTLGKQFYLAGLSKSEYPMDDAGNASFSIAQSYLRPFIVWHNQDSRIGEALYMMGDIRRRLWNDKEYWVENFYLKEAIRRFPHTPLAKKAFKSLESGIHFSYSGSSGDHTPQSVLTMLKTYKAMAEPKKSE
ncbi:MAG: hypothetical protein HQM14_10590 [SAR324 cluster bacterium]|nr:hypothetical protein [SAR324 cluster bacterium]